MRTAVIMPANEKGEECILSSRVGLLVRPVVDSQPLNRRCASASNLAADV